MRRCPVRYQTALLLLLVLFIQILPGCAFQSPYAGRNPENPQFERGHPFPPLDFFGDFISKPFQLLFWTLRYGNHRVSEETEKALAQFLVDYQLQDVKVRINQWAPHKEIGRLVTNKHIAWPYKILYFPSTLIASLLGRPFSGLLISDYYDPASNTIHLFSDEVPIALHEAGHAKDFASRRFKGTYALVRIFPGIDVFQEAVASDEAFNYLEGKENYEELFRAYNILYPAYSTYISSYISFTPFSLLGAIGIGHIIGRSASHDKKEELLNAGKIPPTQIV